MSRYLEPIDFKAHQRMRITGYEGIPTGKLWEMYWERDSAGERVLTRSGPNHPMVVEMYRRASGDRYRRRFPRRSK